MNVESQIRSRIMDALDVIHIELENESHMHSVPENSETHFKLILVSQDFDGLRKVARHQKVYSLIPDLMEAGLHAIALHLYTEQEWQSHRGSSFESPNCMGGSKQT